ncbi:ABC transporter G family member 9 [Capsicum chinense]|nr:ABC transporter G family member 9 [Capsicum chinense]
MLINPSLLLLDEPTSELDSTIILWILNTVKRIASGGHTMITMTHRPSSRLYYMFGKVVLLSEGCPIYCGTASSALEYFSSIGFSISITINPIDILLNLTNAIARMDIMGSSNHLIAEEDQGAQLIESNLTW